MNTCNQSKGSQVETVQCLAGFIGTTSKCLLRYQYPEEGHTPLSPHPPPNSLNDTHCGAMAQA